MSSPIPILDLSHATNPSTRQALLTKLHAAIFNTGFLYIHNHGIQESTIATLSNILPSLFSIPSSSKAKLSKLNSPHFLGYNGYAEERTLGEVDLREQFDFATELPVIWSEDGNQNACGAVDDDDDDDDGRDFSRLFWRLRGPNLWPEEGEVPGFREVLTRYHDAMSELSCRFVHLVEESFGIPVGTFDQFFVSRSWTDTTTSPTCVNSPENECIHRRAFIPPQHRIKLLKYPATNAPGGGQGVGAHKDSSGWLTFLHQVGTEAGLEVLTKSNTWISAPPIEGTLVVNFGNAFEAATEGAVRATVHRVRVPVERDRYSIPFFMGLPLDLTVSEIKGFMPHSVKALRTELEGEDVVEVSAFLDSRWDCLGHSQLRKWMRSHEDVARKWYTEESVRRYLD